MHPLIKLISRGEGQQLDFKKTIQDSRKIARSLVAFANSQGGRLLIGVRDNGSLAGIESEEEAHMIQAAAMVYCRPEVKFSLHFHRIEGKNILEVEIPADPENIYSVKNEDQKWDVLIRDFDQCRVAGAEYVSILKQKRKKQNQLLKLGPAELNILELFRQKNAALSSKQCSKLLKIPFWKTSKIIIQLCVADILEYNPASNQAKLKTQTADFQSGNSFQHDM